MADKSSLEVLGKALASLGLHLPDLKFVQRDSLRAPVQPVTIHEIDRTPVLVERGGGEARIREQCSDSMGVDIGGWASTDADGRMTWKLSNFTCDTGETTVSEPTSFVATPQSSSPVFITTRTVSTGDDLVIEVFSWEASGNPVAKVRFAWRCWFEVLIGPVE